MIRRITFGNIVEWLADKIERIFVPGQIIDSQSAIICDLMHANSQLHMQLGRTQTELTQTKEAYEFYYNAYTESLNNGNKNSQQR